MGKEWFGRMKLIDIMEALAKTHDLLHKIIVLMDFMFAAMVGNI